MPTKIARMSDAEIAAEIERLTRELDALCGRGMFPEPSDPAAQRWKALQQQRRKLEQVAAARSSEEYELRLLAESEYKRREQRREHGANYAPL